MTLEKSIAAILARGNLSLTEAERTLLEAAPPKHLQSKKLLAADAFNRGDSARALELAEQIVAQADTRENQANYIAALRRAKLFDKAVAALKSPTSKLDAIQTASWLSETYAHMGRTDDAAAAGRTALELKDASVPQVTQTPTVLHSFDITQPARQVISFALWGDNPRYINGALRNAIVIRYLYPGWTPRFYLDKSVPEQALVALQREGAQLRMVPDTLPSARFGLFWRFLVEDDPEVTLYAVRDADSVPNIREARAVHEWLQSGQPFHVMRDWHSHSELILAGMWGAHRGNLPGMGNRIRAYIEAQSRRVNDRASDQKFLRAEVWPQMRGRLKAHDRCFGWGDPFPAGSDLPGNMHIGQNDAVTRPQPAPSKGAKA